jgi:LAS superfamily LD-carboxypeptidase LdcB
MIISKPKSIMQTISGELPKQVAGLTDQHIHYFENDTKKIPSPASNAKKIGIHQLMLNDYNALVTDAATDDITIKIASGFRSFERQLLIWNNKFTGKTPIKDIDGAIVNINKLSDLEIIEAILLFSALPGASRHHWGCDIDVYAPNLLGESVLQLEPWEYTSSGPMSKLSSWLVNNAGIYGFYFPYETFRGGIAAEPWHLSYTPLAQQYQMVIDTELLHTLLSTADIAGKETIIKHLPMIYTRYISNVAEPTK